MQAHTMHLTTTAAHTCAAPRKREPERLPTRFAVPTRRLFPDAMFVTAAKLPLSVHFFSVLIQAQLMAYRHGAQAARSYRAHRVTGSK